MGLTMRAVRWRTSRATSSDNESTGLVDHSLRPLPAIRETTGRQGSTLSESVVGQIGVAKRSCDQSLKLTNHKPRLLGSWARPTDPLSCSPTLVWSLLECRFADREACTRTCMRRQVHLSDATSRRELLGCTIARDAQP